MILFEAKRELIKIGTCGWNRIYQYAPPSLRLGRTSLQTYALYFDVVEINSSFYRFHRERTYRGWRKSLPPHFTFTLKCHRSITHDGRLRPTDEALSAFDRNVEDAKLCGASALLLQTPAGLRPSEETFRNAESFFDSIDSRGIPLVWETRGGEWMREENRKRLRGLLERYGVSHVTDILKGAPAYLHDLAYFRLHGLPGYNLKYSYTNEDLKLVLRETERIDRQIDGAVYIFFNNYAMYSDGVRLKRFLESGKPPESPFGPESLRITLNAFEGWPATKEELIDRCGEWHAWVKPEKSVKLKDIMKGLRDGEYRDVDDLISEAKKVWKQADSS